RMYGLEGIPNIKGLYAGLVGAVDNRVRMDRPCFPLDGFGAAPLDDKEKSNAPRLSEALDALQQQASHLGGVGWHLNEWADLKPPLYLQARHRIIDEIGIAEYPTRPPKFALPRIRNTGNRVVHMNQSVVFNVEVRLRAATVNAELGAQNVLV